MDSEPIGMRRQHLFFVTEIKQLFRPSESFRQSFWCYLVIYNIDEAHGFAGINEFGCDARFLLYYRRLPFCEVDDRNSR